MNIISPMAFVHPEAKLGDNNEIGPFCYIDADVVIGDNNKLYNSVTLHQGTRLGNGNEIFPGASISTKPQDLKYRGEASLCVVGKRHNKQRYGKQRKNSSGLEQLAYGKHACCSRLCARQRTHHRKLHKTGW